jgi:mannosyl-oligosaccharide alpha-1,2-mannosidase
VTDSDAGRKSGKLEHLSCFLPGLLALGVHTLPEDVLPVHERQRHLWVAEGLAHTCWLTYADFGTGLGPDEVWFGAPVDEKGEVGPGGALWVDALAKWKEEGAVGQPPGTGQAPPKKEFNEREYWVRSSNYLLRPEVYRFSPI